MSKLFNYEHNKLDVFIPFKKIDSENRRVWAYLTTGDLDHDGQRVDMKAVARALPEWLEWGNIREMHQKVVAGVVQPENAKIDDVGLLCGIDVLRDDTWKLIEGGGYKGTSIGLSDVLVRKSDDCPNGLLTDGGENGKPFKIIEASFVDRPANPKCKIVAIKALADGKLLLDGIKAVEKLIAHPDKGIVSPDGVAAELPPAVPLASAEKFDAGMDANSGTPNMPGFAMAWNTAELGEDLPDMLNCLYGVISQIAWSMDWSPDQKRSGMQLACGEFIDKCSEYLTGQKLLDAKAKLEKVEKIETTTSTATVVETTQDFQKVLDERFAATLATVTEKLAAVEAETEKKLGEAASRIGELAEQKTELVKRLEVLEKTPLPAKAIQNAAHLTVTNKDGNEGQADEMGILTGKLAEMARSNDPNIRQAAATFGAALYKDIMTGGKK